MSTTLPTHSATLSVSADTLTAPSTQPPADRLTRGVLVGRYIIIDCIGDGGMGQVYSAYDPDLGRKVALKLLHDDATGHQRQARLLREAQVMARLSHPNICPVYDVGSFHGRVFFAMEFIDGETLRAWLRARAWEWRELLAVLLAVGRGIAAAHAEGLVHSDLKPENIMLGADERPRVMDFGIARVDGAPRTEAPQSLSGLALDMESRGTRTIKGTPQYMAPEQWHEDSLDARSDQFSFCIVVWEALFGERPFADGHVATHVRARQELRPRPPPQPSLAPSWLRAVLLRGLSARPEDRFPTMDALLVALASGQARRRRSFIAAGAAALALVLGGAAGVRWWEHEQQVAACAGVGESIFADAWNEAVRARLQANFAASGLPDAGDLAARIAGWIDTFAGRWRQVRAEACLVGDVHPLGCLYDQRQRLLGLLDALAEDDPRARSGAIRIAAALPDPRTCADPVLVPSAPPAEGFHAQLVATRLRQELRRIEVSGASGHLHEARARALEVRGQAASAGLPGLHAEATNVAGMLADWDSDYTEAARLLRRAVVEAGASKRDDVAADAAIRLILVVGDHQARHQEALVIGDFAEMLVRRLQQADRYRGARLLGFLAVVHRGTGALSEAEALNERALELLRRELGEVHPELSVSMGHLANIYYQQGKYRESLALHTAALANAEALYGANSIEAAACLTNMGAAHTQLDEDEAALPLQERALAILERALGPEAPDVARARHNFAVALGQLGRHAQAREQIERAYRAVEATLGPTHPQTALTLLDFAFMQKEAGELEAAERNYRRVLALWEETLGTEHPQLVLALNALGGLALQAQRAEEAIVVFERAIKLGETRGSPPELVADARAGLARAVWEARGDRVTALALAGRAAAVFREVRGQRLPALAELEAWMQQLAPP
ncbi:serine/threonine-protein kinase [Nannocystis punicea]|uniref:Serine/threonine-protein kinase n=1 Tax=Nannocystis punicea TaxID=2995304 RepID=A0ABY7GY63_9BACT|nr:serine/threonine-protein kinase [Nannocystis poenicansa]WAS91819.1 serine/threonine-protein kinase [Nannocystis poenicansa]